MRLRHEQQVSAGMSANNQGCACVGGFRFFSPEKIAHLNRGACMLQLCPTLCNPMDCSPLGFSVHGILQARILEWVAISFSRDLPDPGMEPRSPALQADALTSEPTKEAPYDCIAPCIKEVKSSCQCI